MQTPNIHTSSVAIPQIYAYTTPEIHRHDGWTKIGYTEQDVEKRIAQQTHTADIIAKLEWHGNALFEGTAEVFMDHQFHAYLRKLNVDNDPSNEWFHIAPLDAKHHFYDFRENKGILSDLGVIPYHLRDEQKAAVEKTVDCFLGSEKDEKPEFLWNAKPRFGKTLSVYDFMKQIGAQNVLIVTNRPAIANSWYSDYEKFLGTESGYAFVSQVDALKGKALVLTREQYVSQNLNKTEPLKLIEFVSLQDLKGAKKFGGNFDKLNEVADLKWDLLVIDEAHEGVDTQKTDVAFNQIHREFTLHLSGTPFKALANDKFSEDKIYNWTYADEQKAKAEHEDDLSNPYATLPRLTMYTYQMSEIVRDKIAKGVEIDGKTEEYAFDLNEFFRVEKDSFIHNDEVDLFLDAMTTQPKFPFSTEELRQELKHTFWLLNRVDSARLLAKKLQQHPVFKDYEIVLAAGDGKVDEADETAKAFDKVKKAIAEHEKTITLSVGQLTTGVTIPEWSAVLMLSNIQSPALYMQAAFRAQNPCLFHENGQYLRKENAYVFDFDPARTLTIFEEFANDLSSHTSNGRGDVEQRESNIKELLNYFPVYGEADNGEMVELDAEKVMSIPRKIHAKEVVRCGFMSDFLFCNISRVFNAPQAVLDILHEFDPVKEPAKNKNIPIDNTTKEDLAINDDGEVELSEEFVVGKTTDVFGTKIFTSEPEVSETLQKAIDNVSGSDTKDKGFEQVKKTFVTGSVDKLIDAAKQSYGKELSTATQKALQKELAKETEKAVDLVTENFRIKQTELEDKREEAISTSDPENAEEIETINQIYAAESEQLSQNLEEELKKMHQEQAEKNAKQIVETVEKKKREEEKRTLEDSVKDHLRGFSRTIPSFLMAYSGDHEHITLQNFDQIIPDEVFQEVTGVTLDNFRFLRDGGDYEEGDEKRHFDGGFFDPVVFNDAVSEFLRLKKELANYFDAKNEEDIFSYIPPQKTNQIFTPQKVVREMVEMLEQENPGCYDDPDKTFIDLYMKSGLYPAEIVKRLYQSEKMTELYPDDHERLRHIFEHQVYGLAPTEIIYRIVVAYVLGFEGGKEFHHNFRQVDSLPLVKDGKLQEELDKLYN